MFERHLRNHNLKYDKSSTSNVSFSCESCSTMSSCYLEKPRLYAGATAYEGLDACLSRSVLKSNQYNNRKSNIYAGPSSNLGYEGSEYYEGSSNRNFTNNYELKNCSKIKSESPKRTVARVAKYASEPQVRSKSRNAASSSKLKSSSKSMSKLDEYRNQMCKMSNECDCKMFVPQKKFDATRSCCVQLDPKASKYIFKAKHAAGIKKKKNFEACKKSCDKTASSVYLIQLHTKKACDRKEHSIEIEMKTPVIPTPCDVPKCSQETQIKGPALDRAVARCRKWRPPPKGELWPSRLKINAYLKFLATLRLYN